MRHKAGPGSIQPGFIGDVMAGTGRIAAAADASTPRVRLHPEQASPTRDDFQRDRDRILHATAFRRLAHKTQVFVPVEGDHYRTRLTHTIEVAQIARNVAAALGLNEDLAETLALVHDIGHPPFGHAGERAWIVACSGLGCASTTIFMRCGSWSILSSSMRCIAG